MMSNEPVVSVVVRAFNCEKYIGEAIQGILDQTFQDFEIVVVNDASTDATPVILQTYAQRDERVKVFRNEFNQGPVRTMNIGLRHARGEFVAVNDGDDVSLPHRLETQVNFSRVNPQIALVGGGAYIIDEDGEEFRNINLKRMMAEEARHFLETGHSFVHTSVIYRRRCIEAIGLYDEFFLCAHDYDMMVRMADTFDVAHHEEPLVKWRCLNTGITGSKKQAQAAFAELARMRSRAKKEGVSLDLQREYDRLVAVEACMDGIKRNRPLSNARFYYSIALQLLEKGKPRQARGRIRQALRYRDCSMGLVLRLLAFYVLSFWPNSIHFKSIRILREAL
jgi:glycosyltransferase involved in cell wall biosynthesis